MSIVERLLETYDLESILEMNDLTVEEVLEILISLGKIDVDIVMVLDGE